jgi:methylase of polypeptide subunit release factors
VAGLGDHLFDSGAVILEVSKGQAAAVAAMFQAAGCVDVIVTNDLSGTPRTVHAKCTR